MRIIHDISRCVSKNEMGNVIGENAKSKQKTSNKRKQSERKSHEANEKANKSTIAIHGSSEGSRIIMGEIIKLDTPAFGWVAGCNRQQPNRGSG